jgi:hypothetical protein
MQTRNVLRANACSSRRREKTVVRIPLNPRVDFSVQRCESDSQRLWLLLDECESIKRAHSVKSLQSATHLRNEVANRRQICVDFFSRMRGEKKLCYAFVNQLRGTRVKGMSELRGERADHARSATIESDDVLEHSQLAI